VTALERARAALDAAAGDEAEAVVLAERSGLARFAGSEVHQPTLIDNVVVQLRIVREGRVGSASTNRVDPDGLAGLAARAREAAAGARADPDFPGLAEPAEPPAVVGYDKATAALAPEEQARHAREAIDAADDVPVYGFFTSGVTELAIASTTGTAVSQELTDATVLVVAADDACSGYAEATSWSVGDVDAAGVSRAAAAVARRTRDAATLEPGRYRAVLEPYALAELLQYFAYDSLGALGYLEQRSYLADKLGERVFDARVSITDDSLDRDGLPKAFDFEGVPKRRVQLVADGVACGFVWDRTTAARAGGGHESTGHAPPVDVRDYGPLPFALSVAPGEAESVDELAERVGDGIYVTRTHYLSVVQPRDGIVTGTTRDGTFRIRGGRIAEPLVNLRFTVSVPDLLADVPGLSREVRLVNGSDFYGERYPYGVLAPAIATANFNVTGIGGPPGL
jgi:predicted Zn-dependent protease